MEMVGRWTKILAELTALSVSLSVGGRFLATKADPRETYLIEDF